MPRESVLFFLKPDASVRRYVGARTLRRLLDTGLTVTRFAQLTAPHEFLAESHYAIHKGRFFYEWLVDYVSSAPIVVVQLEGDDAVKTVRTLLGATIPAEADPSSIRGRFGIDGGLNVAHASDSAENGALEIGFWTPLLDNAEEPSSDPSDRVEAYIARYIDGAMVDPDRHREVFHALAAGALTPEGAAAEFLKLLAQESDLPEETLVSLARVMVASAAVRKSKED
jgi:nucleoside-diphosphate kinase